MSANHLIGPMSLPDTVDLRTFGITEVVAGQARGPSGKVQQAADAKGAAAAVGAFLPPDFDRPSAALTSL